MSKIALISGATSGFGRAMTQLFANHDWKIIATGRRQQRLDALADEYGKDRIYPLAFDIRDDEALNNAIDSLPDDFKHIDLLVNNAGLALGTGPAQTADLADWKQMIDTNTTALVSLTRKLLPGLIKRRGAIVNLSSISGTYPYPGGNVYGATKAFVTQFSLNLRTDLHGTGVRVTNVEPGQAETEFTLVRTGGNQQASDELYRGTHPIRAEDIAQTVWWIANQPAHLNINRIEIMPVSQSAAGLKVHRDQ